MSKNQTTIKYFPLSSVFCHLVFLFFNVISISYLFAQNDKKNDISKIEIEFLEKILSQVEPNKKFSSKAQLPMEAFTLFQKKSDIHNIWVAYWQFDTFKYPLFVQEVNNEIEDFFLTFPSFMLHDKIHQALINKWGKQDFFQQHNLSAIYSWKNIKGTSTLAAIYEANCSITCFPVALSMQKLKLSAGVTPLWQEFHRQGISKPKKKNKTL